VPREAIDDLANEALDVARLGRRELAGERRRYALRRSNRRWDEVGDRAPIHRGDDRELCPRHAEGTVEGVREDGARRAARDGVLGAPPDLVGDARARARARGGSLTSVKTPSANAAKSWRVTRSGSSPAVSSRTGTKPGARRAARDSASSGTGRTTAPVVVR
jgi:hypothetical protein